MNDRIRILGIDPGSRTTGYGIVDVVAVRTIPVTWGSVSTAGNHSERLKTIFEKLGTVVAEFEPTEIAIERVFLHRNADSALKLGQARAAAICATFSGGAPIHEYSARHIKKAVVGQGGAEKEQVQYMVRTILGIREEVQADAADALAAAICHAHQRGTSDVIQRAVARA